MGLFEQLYLVFQSADLRDVTFDVLQCGQSYDSVSTTFSNSLRSLAGTTREYIRG